MATKETHEDNAIKLAPKAEAKRLALEKLQSSGLNNVHMKTLGMRALSPDETLGLGGAFHKLSALQIPYFDVEGKQTDFYRIRYLETPKGFAGNAKKPQRYAQVPGTLNEVYFPPLLDWSTILSNKQATLYITEGELKAACATSMGLPTMGLGGVDVWRSKKAKLPLLPQLEAIEWKDRKVCIVFDSDASTKPDVARAQSALGSALSDRGAKVYIVALPPTHDGKKQGFDDFLVAHGVAEYYKVEGGASQLEDVLALMGMNEEFVWVQNPSMVVRRKDSIRMSERDFRANYGNRWHVDFSNPDKPKKLQTAKVWLEWPQRADVRNLTYAPGKPKLVDDQWNLWNGWGVEPRKGDIDPWHRLLDFLFKSDPDSREWFERWCAYPLQNPGAKMFTSVAMWGVFHGTGKSQVGYTLRDIYGDNGIEVRNQQLNGSFNSWAENKQFVMGDEVTGSDKRVDADRLKGMITQESILINTKFMKEFSIPDCINYYFTSNHPDAFFIEDSDRRFFVHEVVGKPALFELYDEYDKWRKGDGPSHLFEYLLRVVLGDFRASTPAPMTAAKQEMIFDNKSDLGSWVREMLQDPTTYLRPLGEMVCAKADVLTATQLLKCYDPEGSTRVTAQGLGRELKRCGVRSISQVPTIAGGQRMLVVRNAEKWLNARPRDVGAHWNELFMKKF